jgi:spermidine/putrescine transport system permease protein
MSVERREARQPWILLSPALIAVTLLLFVPLLFILVYSFWLRTATGADQAGFFLDNWHGSAHRPHFTATYCSTR